MKLHLSLLSLVFTFSYAHASPKFKDYPVEVYTGEHASAKITKNTHSYRTRFRQLAKDPISFAGHYALGFVGCGGGCVFGMLYDAKSGSTDFLPSGSITGCFVEGEYFDSEMYFKKDSRLLVLAGKFDGGDKCLTRYYLEKKGKITLLKELPFKPTKDAE